MTDYKFGDIVLVPFPFTDQSAVKKHPAVVVSSSDDNRQRSELIITAVISQTRSASYFGDTAITDWQSAGLLKPTDSILPLGGDEFVDFFRRLSNRRLCAPG